jgi:hypothetical protein
MEEIAMNRIIMSSLLVIAIILFLLGEWILGVLVPVFCGGYYLLARRSVSKGKGYKFYGDFDNDDDGDSGGSDD